MLGVGDRMPEATVWTAPRRRQTLADLTERGPILLVFYLFDFSAT